MEQKEEMLVVVSSEYEDADLDDDETALYKRRLLCVNKRLRSLCDRVYDL